MCTRIRIKIFPIVFPPSLFSAFPLSNLNKPEMCDFRRVPLPPPGLDSQSMPNTFHLGVLYFPSPRDLQITVQVLPRNEGKKKFLLFLAMCFVLLLTRLPIERVYIFLPPVKGSEQFLNSVVCQAAIFPT